MAQDGPSERMDMSNLEAEGLDTAALTESDGYEPASPIKTPDFPPTLAEGDFLDDIVPETFVEGDFLDDLVPGTPVSPTVMRGAGWSSAMSSLPDAPPVPTGLGGGGLPSPSVKRSSQQGVDWPSRCGTNRPRSHESTQSERTRRYGKPSRDGLNPKREEARMQSKDLQQSWIGLMVCSTHRRFRNLDWRNSRSCGKGCFHPNPQIQRAKRKQSVPLQVG